MNTLKRLEELATRDGMIPSVFGSMAQINAMLDRIHQKKRFPIFVSIQPIDGSFTMGDGMYNMTAKDTVHAMVGFADSIKFDYDPEKVQEQVDALKDRCKNLLADINASGDFDTVTEVSYSVLYDSMDANLVIVLMDFNITPLTGDCVWK